MADELIIDDYTSCLRVQRNDRDDTIEITAFTEKELFNLIPRFRDLSNMVMNRKVGLDINKPTHIKHYQRELLKSILSQLVINDTETKQAIEDLQAKI